MSVLPPELTPLNDTPYTIAALPLEPGEISSTLTFIVKGTFDLQPDQPASCAEEQWPLVGADEFVDPEVESATRYESDLAPIKLAADVLCIGHAYPPRSEMTDEVEACFSLGPVSKAIRVLGDRHWSWGVLGFGHRRSRPEPFAAMAVHYGNAYGGKDVGKPKGFRHFKRNRVGKGYSKYGFGVAGSSLPNLTKPRSRMWSWRSRPEPVGLGPIGRTWQPRLALAGRYNRRWLKRRSPEPPTNFDERFYNAAPLDQQVPGYLRGDEALRIDNMHPEYPSFRASLPGTRVRCFIDRQEEDRPRELVEAVLELDTAWIDMDELKLVLVWRARMPVTNTQSSRAFMTIEEPVGSVLSASESHLPRFEALYEEATAEWEEAELEEAERALEAATNQPN